MANITDAFATGEINGTNLNDLMLIGLAYNATIKGLGGDDNIVVGYSVNSIIDGGDGNDTLAVLASGSGGTMMIGGAGNDIMVSGVGIADDKLTFVGVDMTTLLNHTSLAHSGADTIIKFDGGVGGSITLQNVHVNSLSALHIDVLVNASTLVGLFPG